MLGKDEFPGELVYNPNFDLHKMYKNFNLRKEEGITIKSKKRSDHLEPIRNSCVAMMHQLVTISSTM